MEIIKIKTLLDITRPKVSRPGEGSPLEQYQYKNWITLQQCIGLRSIIMYDENPVVETIDIKSSGFGSKYKGEHRVWSFTFYTDRTAAYASDDGNMIGLLLNDIHQVPMIENLTETINISKALFDLEDTQYKNTIITASLHVE